MKLINKEQVSHIVVFKETEGIRVYGRSFWKYTYFEEEYFKLFWIFPIKTLEHGFYRNGEKTSWSKAGDDLYDEKAHYILSGNVYTKCHIQIFSAGKEIHTEYFDTYEQLEQHIKDNYNNCTIRYE